MTSLIQQRMSIDRQRIWGLWLLVDGALMAAGGIGLVITQRSWSGALYIVLFTVVAVRGAIRLVSARRRRLAFESEHGNAAGKQDPVR